jgi:integrase
MQPQHMPGWLPKLTMLRRPGAARQSWLFQSRQAALFHDTPLLPCFFEPRAQLLPGAVVPMRFGVFNPASGIPTEPKVQGTRGLSEDEFVQLYRWLECPDTPVHPSYPRAVQLIMLTGQRVEEIARLRVDQWDAKERIIDWSKTKM